MEAEGLIKNLAIDYFEKTPIYFEIKKYLELVGQTQEAMYIVASSKEDGVLSMLKVGTILSLSITGKMFSGGKKPKEFDTDDWSEIAQKVMEYGIIMDGQKYTEFVFELYARYIEISVNLNKAALSDTAQQEIKGLAEDLRKHARAFERGELTEPDYVDGCLWISFEAMIKLLASYGSKYIPEKYRVIIPATADFAVQYARLKLYSKELEIIEGYLQNQSVLDGDLQNKYNLYIEELDAEANRFSNIIDNAFSPEFEELLCSSVRLGINAGVSEDKLLSSIDEVDAFFDREV
jgi:hypothetical protein